MILPGATLGILGGGQLGRMFVQAAHSLGYRVMVLDPDPESPAGAAADVHLAAGYRDGAALERMGRECAAVTTEFENVPAESLDYLSRSCPVRPSGVAVAIAQERVREKTFLRDHGFATAAFAVVNGFDQLAPAFQLVGPPAVLKTSRMGYDGKGQALVASYGELVSAFEHLKGVPCVLEQFLPLEMEISVVVARGADGKVAVYPVAENRHEDGILDISIVPAQVPARLAERAAEIAVAVAEALDYCGVLAVEFFVLKDGRLLVNEIAPRPHNSGHYTLDACITSQFEQQVRALCGLPLGDTRLLSPVAMINLLGDLWQGGRPPEWQSVLRQPGARLHLYGKREARPGRKMGHCTVLAGGREDALQAALAIKSELLRTTEVFPNPNNATKATRRTCPS